MHAAAAASPACCLRCCALERAPAAVDAALVAICHLAAAAPLQVALLEAGALPYLIPLLLEYDVTLAPEVAARLQLPFSSSSSSAGSGGGAAAGSAAAAAADGSASIYDAGFRLLDSPLVRPNMQEARSQHALLAAQALARLAGAGG